MLEHKARGFVDMGIEITPTPNININFESMKDFASLIPSYDKKFDTFFISPSERTPAVSVDWNGEFWLRVTENGDVIGLEVENFESVFLAKHPEMRLLWKDIKHFCIKNEKTLCQISSKERVRDAKERDECESFLRILLNLFNKIFQTQPSQQALMSP